MSIQTLPLGWKGFLAATLLATLSVSFGQAGELFPPAGRTDLKPTPVPANLQVPAGNALYLKTHASGSQNYVCVPAASGPTWKFLGPQATLFATGSFLGREIRLQIATHFLSSNPEEAGTARATWQSSADTSAVWGKAIADSTDPAYVAPASIPWLLVQAVGNEAGPTGGDMLRETTYIQRVNTAGGIAPAEGCAEDSYGKVALVPYTTDYLFYKASRRR